MLHRKCQTNIRVSNFYFRRNASYTLEVGGWVRCLEKSILSEPARQWICNAKPNIPNQKTLHLSKLLSLKSSLFSICLSLCQTSDTWHLICYFACVIFDIVHLLVCASLQLQSHPSFPSRLSFLPSQNHNNHHLFSLSANFKNPNPCPGRLIKKMINLLELCSIWWMMYVDIGKY